MQLRSSKLEYNPKEVHLQHITFIPEGIADTQKKTSMSVASQQFVMSYIVKEYLKFLKEKSRLIISFQSICFWN